MAANLGNPNLAEIELGTVWNEWQDNWVGRPVEAGTRNIGGQEENKHLLEVFQEEYYKHKKLQLYNKLIKLEQVLEVYLYHKLLDGH